MTKIDGDEIPEMERLAQIGHWFWDLSTNEVRWSPELFKIFEIEPSISLNYESIQALHDESSRKLLVDAVNVALEHGIPYMIELKIPLPNGSTKWVIARGEVVRDKESHIIGLRGTTQVIQERKVLELQRELILKITDLLDQNFDQETQLNQIAEMLLPDYGDFCVILIVENHKISPKGIAHVDKKLLRVLQECASLRELDLNPATLAWKAVLTGEYQILDEVNDTELSFLAVNELQLKLLKDLQIKQLMFLPLTSRQKTIGCMVLGRSQRNRAYTLNEIAFLKLVAGRSALSIENSILFKKEQRSVATREQVLSVVSHDLKSPLMTAKLTANILQRTFASDEIDKQVLLKRVKTLGHALENMDSLIQDLVLFSKLESGTFSVQKGPVCLKDLVTHIDSIMRPLAEDKGLTFEVDYDPELKFIADKNRIGQVLSNVITNAIKYTLKGKVSLRIWQARGKVYFQVSDTGTGISVDQMEHVFEKFWLGEKNSGSSTGLGLYISREIVLAHKGSIWIDRKYTVGTRINFKIPAGLLGEIFPVMTGNTHSIGRYGVQLTS